MHLEYLFAGYSIVWIAVLLYVVGLDRRGRALERELQELRTLLERKRA